MVIVFYAVSQKREMSVYSGSWKGLFTQKVALMKTNRMLNARSGAILEKRRTLNGKSCLD